MSIRVVAFGEILWDIFDEKKVIGGAPFNFAAHLASLGAESYIVSSLGNDENGRDAIAEAKAKGIRTDHISFAVVQRTSESNAILDSGVRIASVPIYKASNLPCGHCRPIWS